MTYDDLIRAAAKADRAGNAAAVQEILTEAQKMRASQSGPVETSVGPIPRADVESVPTEKVDRFGDTISAAIEGPVEMTRHYLGQSQDRSRSRLERAGDYAMTGLGVLGTAAGLGAGVIGETFGGSPTNERKLARDMNILGMVAIPELAGVSSVTRAAASAGRRAAQEIPKPRNSVEQAKRSADDLGVTPSLGSGGKIRAQTAATLEKAPIVSDMIAKDAVRYVDEIEAAAGRLIDRTGTAQAPDVAGEGLQRGLNAYVTRSKDRAKALFDEVGQKIPADTSVPLNNTAQVLEEAKQYFTGNPQLSQTLGLNRWDAIISEAQQNGINWQAVRQFRTSIGEAKAGRGADTLQGEAKSRLDALYGALTRDMEAAATNAGPEARQAWERANKFYRNFAQRVETSLDKTIKANSPERAFEAFDRMLRADAASSDVNRVRKIKASLKPGEWRDLSASIVDRLGKPTAGQQGADGGGFSPSRFLTAWNNMSPEARRILLPGDVRDEWQKLADVAGLAKEANLERNFSNTGNVVAAAALGSAATQAPVSTLFAAGAAWGSAKTMTSPIFLRALNRAGRGDLKQIRAMAGGRGPFAEDARTVLQIMGADTAAQGSANQNTNPLRAVQ